MSQPIHLARTRNALAPRREPYWGAPLARGRYLGVRKLEDGTSTWIARLRDDDGRQRYRSLGQVTKEFEHGKAKEAAEAWFRDFDAGVDDKALSVGDACRAYVDELEAEGRLNAAQDADMRFRRTVYSDAISRLLVNKLKTDRIKAWRSGLGGAKSSQNRNLTALKAALNLAVTHSRVNPSVAQQWRAVKAHKDADGRRALFLDLKQRRALLDACEGSARDLVEAAMLTGARPGEIANLKRADFEPRTGTAKFKGKTGTRDVPLSSSALKLFKRLAKGKLPEAFLLTQDDGRQWKRWDWDDHVREAVAAANLPKGVVLYTLRHSFITEALSGGMTTFDVARLTGTSLVMIEKHYGHLVAGSARERLSRVTMI